MPQNIRSMPVLELPKGGWRRVIARTLLLTLMIVAATTSVTAYTTQTFNGTITEADIMTALFLSLGLAIPMITAFNLQLERLRLANERLRRYAITDGLTGILNRVAFSTRVEELLSTARTENIANPGTLLLVDVDRFKRINDSFGHERGDAALCQIVETISTTLRAHDVFGRLGGEEFGIFLRGANSGSAAEIAERIRMAVADSLFIAAGKPHPLSISIGIASPMRTIHFSDIHQDADRKLYCAKTQGRNRVEQFTCEDIGRRPEAIAV